MGCSGFCHCAYTPFLVGLFVLPCGELLGRDGYGLLMIRRSCHSLCLCGYLFIPARFRRALNIEVGSRLELCRVAESTMMIQPEGKCLLQLAEGQKTVVEVDHPRVLTIPGKNLREIGLDEEEEVAVYLIGKNTLMINAMQKTNWHVFY